VLGMVSGAIAGLVVITPGAGYVDQTGSFIMGIVSGPVCYHAVQLKHYLGFEDALDAFGTHAIGGVLGGLLTGLFANEKVGGVSGAFYGHGMQFAYQLAGVCLTVGYTLVVTSLILGVIEKTVGLRAVPVEQDNDMDASIHGSIHGGSGSMAGSFNGRNASSRSLGNSYNGRYSNSFNPNHASSSFSNKVTGSGKPVGGSPNPRKTQTHSLDDIPEVLLDAPSPSPCSVTQERTPIPETLSPDPATAHLSESSDTSPSPSLSLHPPSLPGGLVSGNTATELV